MTNHTATEQAYRNGYQDGFEAGRRSMERSITPLTPTRDKLIELLNNSPSLGALDDDGYVRGADDLIANGVTVLHTAQWIRADPSCYADEHFWTCSHCGYGSSAGHHYCPYCGAKMGRGV